jgi:Zn-dependent peptidase ImmA (M78 family)
MYYGINKDPKITLLFHKAKTGVNGYIRNIDAYEKVVAPTSNERKIIYLNTDLIDRGWLKETLAHELVHLITLNKKDLRYGVKEDTWLNEARAEYAVTYWDTMKVAKHILIQE